MILVRDVLGLRAAVELVGHVLVANADKAQAPADSLPEAILLSHSSEHAAGNDGDRQDVGAHG